MQEKATKSSNEITECEMRLQVHREKGHQTLMAQEKFKTNVKWRHKRNILDDQIR